MKTIGKLALEYTTPGFYEITLPLRFKILCMKPENGVPTIWYEYVDSADWVSKWLHIVETGSPYNTVPDNSQYLGMLYVDKHEYHYFLS